MLELIGLWGIALFSLLGVCDNIGSCYTNNNNLEPVNQSHSHGQSRSTRNENDQQSTLTVTKYIMALRPSSRESESEGQVQCQNQISTLNSTCVICLEGFCENENQNTTTTTLICKHRYHLSCIRSWLSKNDECPLCMQVVVCDSKESVDSTHTLFN